MARPEGLQPTSLWAALRAPDGREKLLPAIFSNRMKNQSIQTANNKKAPPKTGGAFLLYGAPGRIRTSDRSVRSRVLYPAELQAHNLLLSLRATHYLGLC